MNKKLYSKKNILQILQVHTEQVDHRPARKGGSFKGSGPQTLYCLMLITLLTFNTILLKK